MTDRNREMTRALRRRVLPATGWWREFGLVCLILAGTAMVSAGQDEQPSPDSVKFTTLVNFDGTNGTFPGGTLLQAADGNLYGTTEGGGINNNSNCQEYPNGCGTVFKITPGGTLTTLYNFCAQPNCADGNDPSAGLTQAADGSFYGTTYFGGSGAACTDSRGCGTVFKITPHGTLTTLYSFCAQANCTDGANPDAPLTQATDGNFYGIAQNGGLLSCEGTGCGTIFRITPQGLLTVLHTFNYTDGAIPVSTLIQATDGDFYGVAYLGGANGDGTVFKITSGGTFATLHNFDGTDGISPLGGLVQSGAAFYGTTSGGGINCAADGGCGTVFKITPSGTLTTLYNFCSQTNCSDGDFPSAALAMATDGDFYGTTLDLTMGGNGTVFKISPEGNLTTLHSFDLTDGSFPNGALSQSTNGAFYGTAGGGGASSDGTAFALLVGLAPFVETVPASGKVGMPVKILGANLRGATAVSFSGTAAVFRVISKTLISATVPAGATTGFVTVTTASGTLKSNVRFQVRP